MGGRAAPAAGLLRAACAGVQQLLPCANSSGGRTCPFSSCGGAGRRMCDAPALQAGGRQRAQPVATPRFAPQECATALHAAQCSATEWHHPPASRAGAAAPSPQSRSSARKPARRAPAAAGAAPWPGRSSGATARPPARSARTCMFIAGTACQRGAQEAQSGITCPTVVLCYPVLLAA